MMFSEIQAQAAISYKCRTGHFTAFVVSFARVLHALFGWPGVMNEKLDNAASG